MLRRTTTLATLLAFITLGPVTAFAAPATPAAMASDASENAQHHDAGQFSGTITNVDYQNASITVNAGGRGKIDFAVNPSTQIQGKDSGYHAISDLKAGTRVDVYASESSGRYTAQIIKIK